MATAFLAASWPTMYMSSSATIWRGVSSSSQRGGASGSCARSVDTVSVSFIYSCVPSSSRTVMFRFV